MRGYGQFCPIAQALEIIGERWTLLVVREMLCGSRRFGEIQRGVPLMSPTLLSQRLTRLERAGIVQRNGEGGRYGRYELTEAGRELWAVVESLGVWGQRWARREVEPDHLDTALLMWDMRRRIDLTAVPARRLVVEFRFRGHTRGPATWWLIVHNDDVDLCLTDPGHPVDLTVCADLRSMIKVWMGDLPLATTLRSGEVGLVGSTPMRRAFPTWIKLNLLAGVPRPIPNQYGDGEDRAPRPVPTPAGPTANA